MKKIELPMIEQAARYQSKTLKVKHIIKVRIILLHSNVTQKSQISYTVL